MKTNTRLGLAIAFAAIIAAPVTFTQEDAAPEKMMQGDTMKGSDMQGGDMSGMQGMMGGEESGMQGMMQMMQQMRPMMEACTEMMQAMAAQPHHAVPKNDG